MKAIVSVVGLDQVGIIAGVCNVLAKEKVNVLDIKQTIIDQYFNMMMIVDITDISFDTVADALSQLEKEIGVKIQIQHESIFTSMHRI